MASIVSVIIPTYNRGYCIKRTIDSVLNQSFKDFNLIIIDNNSVDDTEEIINSYKNPKIILKKITNRGVIAASRNKGIFLSQSKYIAFLDSDDWWKPDKLKISIECLENGNDFICHGLEIFRTNNRTKNSKEYTKSTYKLKKPFFNSFMQDGNTIETSSIVLRRDLISSLGGFYECSSLSGSEDYDMWTRISSLTNKFCVIKNNLGYLTYGNDNFSNEHKLKQALPILLPRFEKLCLNNTAKPTYLYYLSCAVYLKSSEFKKFFRFFKLFLINKPKFIKLIKILVNLIFAIFKIAISPK